MDATSPEKLSTKPYRPAIARYALEHCAFGGPEFSFSRMSWIKPNFLWMMYRSAWGTAEGQEVVLGVRIRRAFFDQLLEAAVPSTFGASSFDSLEAWQAALHRSEVRLQWDPDHDPRGGKLERRAIQLGLRGRTLAAYAERETVEILDMTALIDQQRANAATRERWTALRTPEERVYRPADERIAVHLGLADLAHD